MTPELTPTPGASLDNDASEASSSFDSGEEDMSETENPKLYELMNLMLKKMKLEDDIKEKGKEKEAELRAHKNESLQPGEKCFKTSLLSLWKPLWHISQNNRRCKSNF